MAPVKSNAKPTYITPATWKKIPKSPKRLPADATQIGSRSFQFYQLPEHVEFRCSVCQRDGICDDSLAVAPGRAGMLQIQCVKCYSRKVRPRRFRPTRMVPFPSLLSWLSYNPKKTSQTEIEQDVTKRKAEAVLPSAHRVLGADGSARVGSVTSVSALPETPLHIVQTERTLTHQLTSSEPQDTELHPCVRVFGRCTHGAACLFLRASRNESLTFLMGLVDKAGLDEQQHSVWDLPPTQDPRPLAKRQENPIAFDEWIARRKDSTNQAEWQLWNQPTTDELVDRLHPPPLLSSEPLDKPFKPDVQILKDLLAQFKSNV